MRIYLLWNNEHRYFRAIFARIKYLFRFIFRRIESFHDHFSEYLKHKSTILRRVTWRIFQCNWVIKRVKNLCKVNEFSSSKRTSESETLPLIWETIHSWRKDNKILDRYFLISVNNYYSKYYIILVNVQTNHFLKPTSLRKLITFI